MKVKLATAFAAGFLAAAIVGFARPAPRPLCRTGDMTMGIGAESAKELEDFAGAWIHNARECRVGDSGYDAATQAWIDNLDFGADGIVDFRTTEIAGRQVKQELKVGDRWLELLKRDGRTGVVLDGQFMSGADARTKVAATAGSVQ
jgi:hypothetical protein